MRAMSGVMDAEGCCIPTAELLTDSVSVADGDKTKLLTARAGLAERFVGVLESCLVECNMKLETRTIRLQDCLPRRGATVLAHEVTKRVYLTGHNAGISEVGFFVCWHRGD